MTNKQMTSDDYNGSLIEYENMMRDGAPVEKSAYMQSLIEQDMGGGGVWQQEYKALIDTMTLKGLFFSEDWVFICTDAIAMKISSLPLQVMRGEVVDGEFRKEPIEGHQLQKIIDRPNSMQSYESWMYSSVVDLIMGGNFVQWFAPASNSMMMLPIETVAIDLDAQGNVKNYAVVEISSDDGMTGKGKRTPFPKEDIIHCRRPNPSSLLWGLSPFIPGRKSVLFNRYSQDYLNSFYQKGAMPGFALEMTGDANERVAMRMLRTFENAYTGRKNMRRTLVLPKGVALKEVSHTIANQELATHIDKNRETIINILKVPKHVLSLQESGSLGSEEAKTAMKNFWYSMLIPTANLISGELTVFFQRKGILAENEFLDFDYSGVEALQEDLMSKADYAKKCLDSGWTLNEVRTKIWKLDPSTAVGADDPYLMKPQASPFGGFSGLSVGHAINTPQDATSMLQASAEETKVVTSSAPTSSAKAAKDKLSMFLKSGDAWFSRREAKVREDAAKGIREMEKAALDIFGDMAVAITKTVRSHLKEKGWDDYRLKAKDERTKLAKPAELKRRLRSALDKFEERWIDQTRKALTSRLEVGFDVALELPFNLPSRTELEGIKARTAAVRQDALEERQARAFKYLNETTVGKVFQVIERGIDEGKTVQQIADDLRAKFTNIEEIGSRAMTIARTETLTAVSLGQASAMAEARKLIPNLQKMWISADDDRVRDSHESLHGDVVSADAEFKNGLQFPRDPSGPPEEVINCRCTWIMVPKDQMANIDDSLSAEEET